MKTPEASAAQPKRKLLAYTLPMLVFISLLILHGLVKRPGGAIWLRAPEFWIYPLQTLPCGAVMVFFWRDYEFKLPRQPLFALAIALLALALWIAPQQFFGFAARRDGFNPQVFAAAPSLYWTTLLLRFLRLVLVVPLLEEIFWRGFLLRYLISENFTAIRFGTFSWLSFGVVTIAFALSHSTADWPAALLTGALYNLVAYRTRSLASCVLTHALTNLGLGLWIVSTRQWGFW